MVEENFRFGSPAHAGIGPRWRPHSPRRVRFPRTRGDRPPVVQEAIEARELLKELPVFVQSDVSIFERKIYRDAMVEGRGVIEMGNDKAAAEITALAHEIYGERK